MFPEGPPAMKDRLKDRPLMARYGQPKGLVGVGHAHSMLSRNSQRLGRQGGQMDTKQYPGQRDAPMWLSMIYWDDTIHDALAW
jgi:hypothetical protein